MCVIYLIPTTHHYFIPLKQFKKFFTDYKPRSFIQNYSKPTIVATTRARTSCQNYSPTITSIHYYISKADLLPTSLGRFLECRKCYILVVTQALVLYLIYTHSTCKIQCIDDPRFSTKRSRGHASNGITADTVANT